MLCNPTVRLSDLETILGLPHISSDTSDSFTSADRDSDQRPSIVYGLVVIGQGEGGILPVETILLPGGNGGLKLTGRLSEETCLGVGVSGEEFLPMVGVRVGRVRRETIMVLRVIWTRTEDKD